MVRARIILGVIDAEYNGNVFVRGGSGNDRFLGSRAQVSAHLGGVSKNAGRFDDDVDAHLFPGQTGGILLVEYADFSLVDSHCAVARFDFPRIDSVGGVVAKQMRIGFQVGHVVDGNYGEICFITFY